MTPLPPGAIAPSVDVVGRFSALVRDLPDEAVVFADPKVLRLHPKVAKALRGRPVHRVPAGEGSKTLAMVERLASKLVHVSRGATFVALGGGTVGDVVTVLAHLHRRGVRLVQVPSTLLAAVDSSIGGKGAVNVGPVKNALGVFHGAAETWLCDELFTTLSEAQRREGRLEAWKMVVTLDAATARRWLRRAPDDEALLREARDLKEAVVRTDPYEQKGVRVVLNFGHTFGHVLEGLSGFRLRHGEAVGLGMLCALDLGVRLGVTAPSVARAIEAALPTAPRARATLASLLRGASLAKVGALLSADKKGAPGQVRMVLLEELGRWRLGRTPRWR